MLYAWCTPSRALECQLALLFDAYAQPVHVSCMATKTISLSLAAYERLRRAKRRNNESFSNVVMRARWSDQAVTGGEYLRIVRERDPLCIAEELKCVEDAKTADRPPTDKWQTD